MVFPLGVGSVFRTELLDAVRYRAGFLSVDMNDQRGTLSITGIDDE